MTRLIALIALADLELSAAPCHEPCHAEHCPRLAVITLDGSPPRARGQARYSQPPKPLAISVSPIMTSDAAISSVNTGEAAACTSLALWAAKAASSA